MQIAILLYDRFDALDVVGPYEVFTHLPQTEVIVVAERSGPIASDPGGLRFIADATLAEVPNPDVVLVPGGPGKTAPMTDGAAQEWLRAVDATSSWTTSVCTGSLILAAAGLLTGRRATSHWLALERLAELGAEPVGERIAVDGKYLTAAGVSAGLDMALGLVGRIAGDAAAQAIQLGIEYDPQPPYDAGSPSKAPREIVAQVRGTVLTG